MSVSIGRSGEDLACKYLESIGAEIIERNWRNRWCEIDIIAYYQGSLRFIEVKFRKQVGYGTPFEYITRDKLNRLQRASLAWVQARRYSGPYQIDAVSVIGSIDKHQIDYLESITGQQY